MITEIYALLDTIVKISLGALISGLVTYYVAKLNHERELRKIIATRRMDSLEKISEKAEQFIFGWRQWASIVAGILKGRNAPLSEFSDSQWKLIQSKDKKLIEDKEHLYQVLARLRLLGGNDAANHLLRISKAIGGFRDPVILKGAIPSIEELAQVRQVINEAAKSFHQEMHALYEKIGEAA